ncbi:GAF domain-containing protein, partial [Acidobacteria bacterium AH-259-L09]|nr:GAF domain-containing protein [Acidobacteria bacterium AH-259-L09]
RDFDSRVTVTSGDEFQELATSFNTMAGRLGRQFSALTMMNQIDRAILTALDTEEVADTLLTRMRDILPFKSISVTFFDSDDTQMARTYVSPANSKGERQVAKTALTPEEVQILRNNSEGVTINGDKINGDASLPSYLAPLAGSGIGSFLVLPLFVEDRLSGIISLGRLDAAAYSQEDLLHARQVADQVAVALSSAHLVTQRRELTSLFERYVSPEVAAEILKRRREIVLAGQEKTATVLFSDIRNFTALTAGKPSAQVLSWLNNYFTAMSEIIMRNGGFLNKFMGDGLLVVFGVPLSVSVEQDACRAVRSALEMLDRVERINAEKRADQPQFQIGIGLHTGTLTAGNVGTRERMEYSVIGETVNLASRLQALTKVFKVGVLTSTQTQELVKAQFERKLLGEVAIRGFPGRSRVYTVSNKAISNKAKSENCQLTEGRSASHAI